MPVNKEVVREVEVFTGTAKTGHNAGKPFNKYTLIMDTGLKYSCNFDKPSCAGGDTISFDTNPPNSYSNGQELAIVKTIRIDSASASPAAPVKAATKQGGFNTVFPVPTSHDRTATLRVAAIDAAVQFVGRKYATKDQSTDKVIETAYEFAQFISGQLDQQLVEGAKAQIKEAAKNTDDISF